MRCRARSASTRRCKWATSAKTVEVTAQTPLLQTENAALGQVVEARKVLEMPLNGRNVFGLVALVPGVVPGGQSGTTPTGTNPFAWGNYQIGGGQANQSASYIDGGPVNASYVNLTALVPTQDAIQEFRVQTNNLGPEFGRLAGGAINLTTKSGTNCFHGSAYEFLRNRSLNANTFFNNRAGVQRPAFSQNQYGANIGGPVMKDKTFFFFSVGGIPAAAGRLLRLHGSDGRDAGRGFLKRAEQCREHDSDLRSAHYLRQAGQCGLRQAMRTGTTSSRACRFRAT